MSRLFFLSILAMWSCVTSDSVDTFFNIATIEYDEALEQGFTRVSVDVYLLEKETETVILSLQYSNDHEDLLTKSWRFNRVLPKDFFDSLVYGNDMNYLTNMCTVDTIREDFYLIDKKNRIFVGHIFDQPGESYTEITYYIPRN